MGNLTIYTLADAARWDAVVRTFQNYDVYYLSGYVKAFRLHGDGEPLLIYYEGENLRGINAVMRRDIALDPRFAWTLPEGEYFDLATPYGYGGWLLEGEGDKASLFTAYEDWCRRNKAVSEFVRFDPVLENQEAARGSYDVIPLGGSVIMDISTPEVIWGNLISKNRNMIRKAQKNGLRVYHGRFPEIYETFREIYNATMDKDGAESYYYFGPAFYGSVLNDLPHNVQVFYVETEDGTVAAASIMLAANGRMNYHLSGSRGELRHLAPSNLLLYEAALWGCANGCKTLHLGEGLGSAEDSLFQFKKSFYRGEVRPRHIGQKIFLPEEYERLVAMRMDLPEGGFFPRYRA